MEKSIQLEAGKYFISRNSLPPFFSVLFVQLKWCPVLIFFTPEGVKFAVQSLGECRLVVQELT